MAREFQWQNNLSAVINDWRERPFNFENFNCLFWAFAAIKAVNGLDILPEYSAHASSEKAGAMALRKIDNVKTCQELLLKRLGGELQPVAFARPGDIVFMEDKNPAFKIQQELKMFGPVPGVCYGVMSFFVGQNGLEEIPTMQLDSALWVS